jgi:uncharacterized protein YebE (UPF0316 family)
MEFFKGLDPDLVSWVIIPVLIFLARLVDVSLGTLRIVFVSKGNKNLAPLLGFVEVLIWLVAIGQMVVRVITVEPATELIENLTGKGYRLTCVDAYGTRGKVNLLFMIIRRRDLDYIRGLIRLYNPNAFYSIEDVRAVSDPNIPTTETLKSDRWQLFFPLRKGK